MASIRAIKLAGGAGEPDSVLARRIDVIAAAVAWEKTLHKSCDSPQKEYDHEVNEDKLQQAVSRYNRALKARKP